MRFSLLHATRGTPERAIDTRNRWIAAAKTPEDVEHLFAYQSDDEASARAIGENPDMVSVETAPPPDWASSSVANWNAAAAISTGDWLIVIADDLLPVKGWDDLLRSDISTEHEINTPLALQAFDGINDDDLLRHPIINRELYEARGFVFHPAFYGVYCDNDLTVWCKINARIHRTNSFSVQHIHPLTGARDMDEITLLQNTGRAYQYGAKMFARRWERPDRNSPDSR